MDIKCNENLLNNERAILIDCSVIKNVFYISDKNETSSVCTYLKFDKNTSKYSLITRHSILNKIIEVENYSTLSEEELFMKSTIYNLEFDFKLLVAIQKYCETNDFKKFNSLVTVYEEIIRV